MSTPKRAAGRPRTGSVSWHGPAEHRGDLARGHWDVQVTLPGGKRSNPSCMPVDVDEAAARVLAANWTRRATEGELVHQDSPAARGDVEPLPWPQTAGVYFIASGGKVKIGAAQNVSRRLRALQTGNPEPFDLLAIVAGDRAIEQALHQRFKRLRIDGEWFKHQGALAAFIEETRRG